MFFRRFLPPRAGDGGAKDWVLILDDAEKYPAPKP